MNKLLVISALLGVCVVFCSASPWGGGRRPDGDHTGKPRPFGGLEDHTAGPDRKKNCTKNNSTARPGQDQRGGRPKPPFGGKKPGRDHTEGPGIAPQFRLDHTEGPGQKKNCTKKDSTARPGESQRGGRPRPPFGGKGPFGDHTEGPNPFEDQTGGPRKKDGRGGRG